MIEVYKAINQLSAEIRRLKEGIKSTEKVIIEKEKTIEDLNRSVQEWIAKDEKSK